MPGNKTSHAARVAGKNGSSLISDRKFRDMYAALLQCSLLDAHLRTLAGYEAWTGRLAGTAGVVTCLRTDDSIALTPRGVLATFLLHGSLALPKTTSSTASHLASTTGEAQRHKLEMRGGIAVVFTSTTESESMRAIFAAAALQALPMLYVLEGGTPSAEIRGKIPAICVDGTDTVAVYRVAYESVLRAREGGGPTIIECAAWPGIGGDVDPLVKLEGYLAAKRLFRRDWKQRLEEKYSKAMAEAVGSIWPVKV
ncbi:MAG TPA: thiamine pyrophosphate-dependent enzyme [Acidobacteriaceae bacterium]|nr:thiamine pyrophosphate-dependent enzyme [Acidobacteriaceae bacterium]